jgi:hypothetical protein
LPKLPGVENRVVLTKAVIDSSRMTNGLNEEPVCRIACADLLNLLIEVIAADHRFDFSGLRLNGKVNGPSILFQRDANLVFRSVHGSNHRHESLLQFSDAALAFGPCNVLRRYLRR